MLPSALSLLVDPWTISQNSPGLVFLAVPLTSQLCATSVLSSASYIAAWLILQNADFFLLPCTYACVLSRVQLFCDPMDCGPPGSSVYGILQARILEWVVIPFSRGSSQPKDWTLVSCIAGRFYIIWTTTEDPYDIHSYLICDFSYIRYFNDYCWINSKPITPPLNSSW